MAEACAYVICIYVCMNGQILRRSAGKLVPNSIAFAITLYCIVVGFLHAITHLHVFMAGCAGNS